MTVSDDPLQAQDKLECLIRLCAYEDAALYEVLWDLWTRFPDLRDRRDEVTAALGVAVRRLTSAGTVELRWSTWSPHVIGQRVPLDQVDAVLSEARWWESGENFLTVVLGEGERRRGRSYAECIEWRAQPDSSGDGKA